MDPRGPSWINKLINELNASEMCVRSTCVSVVCMWNVQKKSRMRSLVTKLRDRVAGLQLKVEQLQIDKEALR